MIAELCIFALRVRGSRDQDTQFVRTLHFHIFDLFASAKYGQAGAIPVNTVFAGNSNVVFTVMNTQATALTTISIVMVGIREW